MTPTPSNERVEKLCRAAATSIGINVADLLESQRMELFALLTAFEADVRADAQAAAYMAGGEVVRKYKDEVADLRAQLAAMTERSDAWMTVTGKFDISKQPENKSCLQYVCDEIADLRADRDRYRAACGAMEADKKRLDWLEGAKAADYLEGPRQWQINYNARLRADTLRSAIDAAMQQHPASPSS